MSAEALVKQLLKGLEKSFWNLEEITVIVFVIVQLEVSIDNPFF